MSIAAEYLSENTRMTTEQIQAALLPALAGGTNFSDWRDWDRDSFRAYPNNYSDTGVRIYYDAVDPRPGGFGIIDVTVNAHRLIKVPPIRVNFA
ncbi:hypothetical protein PMG71_15430 [Roseofilum sp. BLCC_M154]|uniref:Uncharacterized protein n=1 Tax=Roseofilum acuticapitatum BLCC-M154 TaxID=3022444 RepID=A0ABT7AWM1_9CYAN|nr:hypothetical protein [Roseofilum acuticapitatum]MDJ1170824.1 hypothetical protein [Roseofilum acuticapitatum BLCC-M154]